MSGTSSPEDAWSERARAELEKVVRERSGLLFHALRRSTLVAAASRVMARVGIDTPDGLIDLLRRDGAVFDDFMAEVTIGETYFFRESAHFALLKSRILPALRAARSPGAKLRAWSAGCSTGEEAYSLALTLRDENLPAIVVGTDVSRARLAAARRGEYRRWSFRGVPAATIERDFTKQGEERFVLKGEVRKDVEFRYLNLASDLYPAMSTGVWGMDVILCRNVLIYFDRDTIAHVARSLVDTLSEDGWLLLGATDPPLAEFVRCEVVSTEAGLVYRRKRAAPVHALTQTAEVDVAPAAPFVALPVPRELAKRAEPPMEIERGVPTSGMTNAPLAKGAPHEPDVAALYGARDYEGTVQALTQRATAATLGAPDFVRYVRALANLGRLAEAGRACATALERNPNDAELHYLHAVLVADSGQFNESARAARRAVYLDQSLVVARLALGTATWRAGNPHGALRAFEAAERLLMAMPVDEIVRATDGEPAGRLLEMTRMQIKLARREAAA